MEQTPCLILVQANDARIFFQKLGVFGYLSDWFNSGETIFWGHFRENGLVYQGDLGSSPHNSCAVYSISSKGIYRSFVGSIFRPGVVSPSSIAVQTFCSKDIE